MRARTQLPRELAADLNHAHGLAVLFAEQRHGTQRLRVIQRHDAGRDFEVVADRVVRDLFDLAARRRRKRLIPGEVEPHVPGTVVGARLVSVWTQRLPQCRMNEMRRRMSLGRTATPIGVDEGGGFIPHADLACTNLHLVAHEPRDGPLHIEHLEVETGSDDAARICFLPAGFRVERRLRQDHFRDLPHDGTVDRCSADDETENARLGLQLVVAREHRLAPRSDRAVDRQVGKESLLGPRVGLRPRALVEHEPIECGAIDGEAVLFRHLEGQIDRETEGVVKQKGCIARELRRACIPRLRDSEIQDAGAAGERAQKRLFFGIGETPDAVVALLDFGVRGLHRVARRREEFAESRGVDPQQAHCAHSSTHQTPEDVPAALVRRGHSVTHEHQRRAHVIGDHAHPHVVVVVGSVAPARDFGRPIEHGSHLIDLVQIFDALLEKGDPFEAHTGVDILARQFAQDLEVMCPDGCSAQPLHEDEIPDLDVSVVVGGRAAPATVGGAAVEEDLGVGPRGARRSHRPVVVGLAHALDALIRKSGRLLPVASCVVVVFVDRDPEVSLLEAEAAVRFGLREQLPGIRDRLFLEVIAEREVAIHLKERAVTGGLADLFDVEGPNALLHTGGTRVWSGYESGQVRHEWHHAGDREKERRVVAHQRGRRHYGVTAVSKEVEPAVADVSGQHLPRRAVLRRGSDSPPRQLP